MFFIMGSAAAVRFGPDEAFLEPLGCYRANVIIDDAVFREIICDDIVVRDRSDGQQIFLFILEQVPDQLQCVEGLGGHRLSPFVLERQAWLDGYQIYCTLF